MRQTAARVALLVAAAGNAFTGLWALLAPRSWYDDFPGAGHHWVAPLGAYDQHLAVDVGAALLALSVLAAWGGIVRGAQMRIAAAVGLLVFGVPHLAFHAATGGLAPGENAASLTSLSLDVALPAAALLLTCLPARTRRTASRRTAQQGASR